MAVSQAERFSFNSDQYQMRIESIRLPADKSNVLADLLLCRRLPAETKRNHNFQALTTVIESNLL